MWADQALDLVLGNCKPGDILDIGSGDGEHSRRFERAGWRVEPVDWQNGTAYEDITFDREFDCIWASHVLEHMPDVQTSLEKMRHDLKPGGVLAITVPPLKHEIVGGHVSLWNAGLLLYRLILAGFDCSRAMIKTYGYNISAIVERVDIDLPVLARDAGDIELLAPFFPMKVHEGFNGDIESINWHGRK